MKTLTFLPTLRIMVACLFASGVVFSDTFNSSAQYSMELESKQASLMTISEDTTSIEAALEKKIAAESSEQKKGKGAMLDRVRITGHDIAALMPASPRPIFEMRATPYNTVTPQGSTGVVDRGLSEKRPGKK